MTITSDWEEVAARLAEPFPADAIKQREGRGGLSFSYIDARDVENRLDEVVGPANWSDRYTVIDPERMGMLCELTVLGVTKSGVGYPNNPVGGKGESSEPGKDSESDALKRAAVKFGIGRHLYDEKPTKNGQQRSNTVDIRANKPSTPAAGKPSTEAIRAELCKRAAELAYRRGKGETDMAMIRHFGEEVGIAVPDKAALERLSDAQLTAIGKAVRSQLDILANSEQAPAVETQTF